MIFLSHDALSDWTNLLGLLVHLVAGIVLGVLYFGSLWWNACRFGRAPKTIALMIGRFVILGGLLTLASLEGPLPLLMTALGVLVARSAVMRRVREAAP